MASFKHGDPLFHGTGFHYSSQINRRERANWMMMLANQILGWEFLYPYALAYTAGLKPDRKDASDGVNRSDKWLENRISVPLGRDKADDARWAALATLRLAQCTGSADAGAAQQEPADAGSADRGVDLGVSSRRTLASTSIRPTLLCSHAPTPSPQCLSVPRGLHHAAACFVLIGVRLVFRLCPNWGFRPKGQGEYQACMGEYQACRGQALH